MIDLGSDRIARLTVFLRALVDPARAHEIVAPTEASDGHWFGGGNLVEDDGALHVIGRYRDRGDSRTGLAAGVRGRELAVFRSDDIGASFHKVFSWSKRDLERAAGLGEGHVLSIEGSALHRRRDGRWELFVSTEKVREYPHPWQGHRKPGTGVWSIDVAEAPTLSALADASFAPLLSTDRPDHLHVKDPNLFDDESGTLHLFACTHPFTWASSNTAVWSRPAGEDGFGEATWDVVPRGNVWDVAATRVTNVLSVPRVGLFADGAPVRVLFYDGAESLRRLDENPKAVSRPRGWSCEEIGGAMVAVGEEWTRATRLSRDEAWFTSPHGTGSLRYVSTLVTSDAVYATWQMAQENGAQPLFLRRMDMVEAQNLLGG